MKFPFPTAGKYRRLIILAAAGIILPALLITELKIIRDRSVVSQLPDTEGFTWANRAQIEQMTSSLDRAKRKPSGKNIGALGQVYHSNLLFDQASKCYLVASERNRKQWKWDYYNGYLKREMGDSRSALVFFERAAFKNRKASLAYYYIADLYNNLGKSDSALILYKKVLEIEKQKNGEQSNNGGISFPLSIHTNYQISRILTDLNRYDEAESLLKEIIEEEPYFGPVYRLLGTVYLMKGDSLSGKKYTVMANDHLPYYPPADTLADRLALISRSDQYLLKQIDAAIGNRNYEWAVKLINHALLYYPDDKYLIAKAVRIFLWLNLDKQAIAYLDKHLMYYREDFDQLKEVTEILLNNGYIVQGLKYFSQLVKLKNDDPAGQSDLAIWAFGYNLKKEALELSENLVKKNPSNPKLLYNISYILLSDKKLSEARKYINLLSNLPDSDPLHIIILSGLMAENENKIPEAISLYEEALNMGKNDLRFLYYLGNLYFSEKMWAMALEFHLKALGLFPNDPNILGKLGYLLASCPDTTLRNYTEAGEYSARAFRHYATIPIMRISAGESLAIASFKTGKTKEAAETIKITIDMAQRYKLPADGISRLQDLQRKISYYEKSN